MVQVGGPGGPTDPSGNVDGMNFSSRPQREPDSLEGLLLVTRCPLDPSHRERIIDMLRVIQGTQVGRELLHDFRALLALGKSPSLDLAAPDEIPGRESDVPDGLFLGHDVLTAGASAIGLPPEEEHAPAIVRRLTQVRNFLAVHSRDGQAHSWRNEALNVSMDPDATAAACRRELEAAAARRAKVMAVGLNGHGGTKQYPVPHKDSIGGSPYQAVTEPPGAIAGIVHVQANDGAQPVENHTGPGGAHRAFRWAEQKAGAFKNFLLRRREPGRTDEPPSQVDRPIIKDSTEPKTERHKRTPSNW